jgi:hypothetical protein
MHNLLYKENMQDGVKVLKFQNNRKMIQIASLYRYPFPFLSPINYSGYSDFPAENLR